MCLWGSDVFWQAPGVGFYREGGHLATITGEAGLPVRPKGYKGLNHETASRCSGPVIAYRLLLSDDALCADGDICAVGASRLLDRGHAWRGSGDGDRADGHARTDAGLGGA